jgi:outer membrane murein-binding lipoprotein Lpp
MTNRRNRTTVTLAAACIAGLGWLTLAGCESEPKRTDIRTDAQRVDKIREDKQREDKILPTWKPKEKSWWE